MVLFAANLSSFAMEVLDTSFKPVTSGTYSSVQRIAQRPDGKIVIAGGFLIAGGFRNDGIAFLNDDGTADTSFQIALEATNSPYNTAVISLDVQNDNKIIFGGNFNKVQGVIRNGLARLNADGTVDTSFDVGQGFSSSISIIKVLPDGKILVGGNFNSFNSQSVGNLVRLNSDGTLDNSFARILTNDPVQDIALQPDGKIIIVGDIYSVGGVIISSGVARLNDNGTSDSTFNARNRAVYNVYSVVLQNDGKIVLGGLFTTFNGTNHKGMVRLNSDGSIDDNFTANVGNVIPSVLSLAIQTDGKIILGGRNIMSVNSVNRNDIARVNSDGSLDTNFTTSIDIDNGIESVDAIYVLPNQTILIGGNIITVNQKFRVGFAALNSDGTVADSFSQGVSDVGLVTNIVTQPNGKTYIGGNFTHVDGTITQGIARLNTKGNLDTDFNTGGGVKGSVNAVAVQNDGKIIIGGSIDSYHGIGRGNITRINTDGSFDSSFKPVEGINASVMDIVIQPDNKILVVGDFFRKIIRLNADGTQDASFNFGTGASGSVKTVVLQPDGKVIIAGNFDNYNGTARNRIARLNSNGSIDNTFNPSGGLDSNVFDLALQNDGKIIAVGIFTKANGVTRNRVVRLNADGSVDLSFDPGTGCNNTVYSVLLQPDGKIVLGGTFDNYNGISRSRLVRVLSNGSIDVTFASNLKLSYAGQTGGPRVHSLALEGNNLLIGGIFSKVNGVNWASVARLTDIFNSSGKAMYDFDGDGKADLSVFRPANGVWYLQQSTNGFTGAQFGVSTDKLVPADYDGDGKTDLAVYRNGIWYLQRSSAGFTGISFGAADDIPQPADFDGDGKAELAVWRPSNGVWYVMNLATNQFTSTQFGASTDKPVASDYNGDGKADYAVFRPSNGFWYIARATGIPSQNFDSIQLGVSTDKPVPADYDGDGKTDVAVYRPSNGVWYLQRSTAGFLGVQFGISTDLPVPADYDGDGKADIAVYRDGNWYLNRTTAGFLGIQFGAPTDKPAPSSFVP